MLPELKKLYRAGILTPSGFYRLAGSFLHTGVNLMALLRFASRVNPGKPAITDDLETVTYRDLYIQTDRLAHSLHKDYKIGAKQKVAIVCRNHAALIRSLFAASQLGADIYLLNIEMSSAQLCSQMERHNFDLVIYDAEVTETIDNSNHSGSRLFSYHATSPSADSISRDITIPGGGRRHQQGGNLVVLSGGTTGDFKTVPRRQGVMRYLNPLCSLLVLANLDERRSVYIATPICHGYGLASAFISMLLGTSIYLRQKFDAARACALIRQHNIEAVTLVPIMLHRMIRHDPAALNGLASIISGGAPINPVLVQETIDKLGMKLFNLYGTSEAGVSVLATPADLMYAANTIGKELAGVELKIFDEHNNEVGNGTIGRICIRNSWSVRKTTRTWVETGDMGHKDESGYYFLCGRVDDMIISGGENVYPVTLEHALLSHPAIREAAVIGVSDTEFGQRLKAFIVTDDDNKPDTAQLLEWLSTRVARYQLPVQIVQLVELPYTSIGKPDKKRLPGYVPVGAQLAG